MTSTGNQQHVESLIHELESIRERYLNLVDLHGQLQTQNSLLEDRVLTLVETSAEEKNQLQKSLDDAEQQIAYLQETVQELQNDKQRYKDDCNLAVRLLHQHPQEFIATTSNDMQEKLKARYEPASAASQRSILMPTFPPTFVAPPSFLATPSGAPASSQTENLRLAAEALFKSNSVHRSTATHYLCSNCSRSVQRCDVSIQASLDGSVNPAQASRLRLVSLASDDEGLASDGAWLSIDPPHSHSIQQEYPTNATKPVTYGAGYLPFSSYPTSTMYNV